jgi:hypothetical protein
MKARKPTTPDPPEPLLRPSQAAELGATALRNLARPLAFDANRWSKLGARDRVAYNAFVDRTRALLAAKILADLADELATRERAAILSKSRVSLDPPAPPPTPAKAKDRH